jgi:hypothetical protein
MNDVPDPGEFDPGPLPRTAQRDREFAAARELRDRVEAMVWEIRDAQEWVVKPGELDIVFVGTFARATASYRAALLLCDRGFGDQAGMLNRSLFEHMVVAWWMGLHGDDAFLVERLRRHYDHGSVLFDRAEAQHPEIALGADPDRKVLSDDYIAELDSEFGRFGGQWHGKRLDELVREVEEGWTERFPGVVWKFFRIVNHWNNYLLHHSSVGVVRGFDWGDGTTTTVRLGPSEETVQAPLWTTYWCYGLLVLCTLRRLSPERAEPFLAFFEPRAAWFMSFTREQVKDVGRNDDCPCGSGEKFKRCHEPCLLPG